MPPRSEERVSHCLQTRYPYMQLAILLQIFLTLKADCPAGKYAGVGSVVGQQDQSFGFSASSVCFRCDQGMFQDEPNMHMCKDCPGGMFANQEGATHCETAPPTKNPTLAPTTAPTLHPTLKPTLQPPTHTPTATPTLTPAPTAAPEDAGMFALVTAAPVPQLMWSIVTAAPSAIPTLSPTPVPTLIPTPAPTPRPTLQPTPSPSPAPTTNPTYHPTYDPSTTPTPSPTAVPTVSPTPAPSATPTNSPTPTPTVSPTTAPSPVPTLTPTPAPTPTPSTTPTPAPTPSPTPACQSGRYRKFLHAENDDGGKWSKAELAASECVECPAGKYSTLDADMCNVCLSGQFSSAGAHTCEGCPSGKYASVDAKDCSGCPAGRYSNADSKLCVLCPVGKYAMVGAGKCDYCDKGKFTGDVTGASYCRTCSPGTYALRHSSTCTNCPDGYFSRGGTGSCTACPAGKYVGTVLAGTDQDLDQVAPPESLLGSSPAPGGELRKEKLGAEKCKLCPAGKYVSGAGAFKCDKCTRGRAAMPGQGKCKSCLQGRFSVGYQEPPAPTAATATSSNAPADAVSGAPHRPPLTNAECGICAAGRYSHVRASKCRPCKPGKYVPPPGGAGFCRECPGGYFADGFTSSSSNSSRGGGSEPTEQRGSDMCKACEAGQYAELAKSSCKDCKPGHAAPKASNHCPSCEKGMYQPWPGRGHCYGCLNGMYGPDKGLVLCEECPAGKHSYSTNPKFEVLPKTPKRKVPKKKQAANVAKNFGIIVPPSRPHIGSSLKDDIAYASISHLALKNKQRGHGHGHGHGRGRGHGPHLDAKVQGRIASLLGSRAASMLAGGKGRQVVAPDADPHSLVGKAAITHTNEQGGGLGGGDLFGTRLQHLKDRPDLVAKAVPDVYDASEHQHAGHKQRRRQRHKKSGENMQGHSYANQWLYHQMHIKNEAAAHTPDNTVHRGTVDMSAIDAILHPGVSAPDADVESSPSTVGDYLKRQRDDTDKEEVSYHHEGRTVDEDAIDAILHTPPSSNDVSTSSVTSSASGGGGGGGSSQTSGNSAGEAAIDAILHHHRRRLDSSSYAAEAAKAAEAAEAAKAAVPQPVIAPGPTHCNWCPRGYYSPRKATGKATGLTHLPTASGWGVLIPGQGGVVRQKTSIAMARTAATSPDAVLAWMRASEQRHGHCGACAAGRYGQPNSPNGGIETKAHCSGECRAGHWGGAGQTNALCQGVCSSGRYGKGGDIGPNCTGVCVAGRYSRPGQSGCESW